MAAVSKHSVLLRAPPKSVFQLLSDPTMLEEFTKWRVDADEPLADGVTWTERRALRKRTWTVSTFDRRGLSFAMEGSGVTVHFAAKKGGPGSCNAHMRITGEPPAVARFEKSDGDRLDLLKAWLESDDA